MRSSGGRGARRRAGDVAGGARPAPARDAGRAGPDLRQVRPAALDPPRPDAARDHQRAAPAAGLGLALLLRGGAAGDPPGAERRDRRPVRRLRPGAGGGRLDRPGAPGRAAHRPLGGGEGAASQRPAPDRGRHRAAAPGRQDREEPRRAPRVRGHGGAGGRVRPLHHARARLPDRGPERRGVPAHVRRVDHRRDPQGLLDVLQRAGADAGADRGHHAQRHRPVDAGSGRAPPAGVPDGGGMAGDGVPLRHLPRRPASGQPVRDGGRQAGDRRLRHHRRALADRHAPPHAAAGGRRQREHRPAAAAAARPRGALQQRPGGGVPAGAARGLLPLPRRRAGRDRPDRGRARGLLADRPHAPAPAHPFRAAGQDAGHARLGGRRAVPGVQRVRGGRALRRRADGAAAVTLGPARSRPGGADELRRPADGAALPGARHARAVPRRRGGGAVPPPRARPAHRPRPTSSPTGW